MMTIAGLSPSRSTERSTSRLETLAPSEDTRSSKRRERLHDPVSHDGVARRDPLVAATLQAAQGTANAEAATTLKDAAVAFAHELFGALRDISARSVEHAHPQRGRHHAYGNLAQRLDALASRIEAGSLATPESAAAPEPIVDTATEAAAVAEVPDEAQPVDLAQAEPAETPEATTESRLVTAFERLVRAQNPGAAKASAAEAGAGSASSTQLADFLRRVAQALRSNGPAADAHAPMAGSLVNLSA